MVHNHTPVHSCNGGVSTITHTQALRERGTKTDDHDGRARDANLALRGEETSGSSRRAGGRAERAAPLWAEPPSSWSPCRSCTRPHRPPRRRQNKAPPWCRLRKRESRNRLKVNPRAPAVGRDFRVHPELNWLQSSRCGRSPNEWNQHLWEWKTDFYILMSSKKKVFYSVS